MPGQGTLESIATTLAHLFYPLEEELQVGRIRVLFAELGMEFPPELETKTAFVTSLVTTVSAVEQLPGLITNLIKAVDEEDFSRILSIGAEMFATIRNIVEGVKTIEEELKNLAGSLPGISSTELNAFASNLPKKIIDYLIIKNLEGTPGFAEILEFIDVVERKDVLSGGFSYTTRTLKIDQFFNFISKPGQHLENLYSWGKPTFDGVELFKTIERLLVSTGIPVILDQTVNPPVLDLTYLEVKPRTDLDPKGLEIQLLDKIIVESQEFTKDDWKLKFEFGVELGTGFRFIIQPNGKITFMPPSGDMSGQALLEWIAGKTDGTPYVILGQSGGSRLEAKQFSIKGGLGIVWDSTTRQATGDFKIGGEIKGGKFFVDFSQGDGFLNQILSSIKLESDFDLGFGYSSKEGVYFYGSTALVIQLPIHLDLGPIQITDMSLGIGLENGKIPIDLGLNFKAELGPLKLVVEQIGVSVDLSFPADHKGNLGPVNLDFSFKPPNGVGLSINAGPITGGGYLFFDFDRGEYAGVLQLDISGFVTITAIGMITTKMPDGTKGFSLLVIMTVEFSPGIQLGFGFTFIGIGGLLGLNRTVKLEVLAQGIRNGTLNNIMFPQGDIIANAPRIISDLRAIFPPEEGKFLIGPMVKLGWGTPTLISVALGVIIEIPGNFAIVGVFKVALPTADAPLIIIQVAFIGAVEFDKQRLWFFASMFDSRVLFITLEGEMGLLIGWGSDANFVVSVGGFHPRFNPPPLPFPSPRRIALDLSNNPLYRVRIEGYFAVTSNTVQFGARAELTFGLDDFGISGHISFDALFQFSPFHFIVEISASVCLNVFGFKAFSIRLEFSLEGTTPYRARGSGYISILFWEFSADFDVTWGDSQNTTLPPIDVMPLLKAEFEKLENWKAELPVGNNLMVSLRELKGPADLLVLHPVGVLRISQRAVPLDLTLDKLGSQSARDGKKFSVGVNTVNLGPKGKVDEQFALAQFQNMSDAEKLSRPAFQPNPGGLDISVSGNQLRTSKVVKRVVRYETIIIDSNYKRFVIKYFKLVGSLFYHFVLGSAVTKSVVSQSYKQERKPYADAVQLRPDQYAVAFNSNNAAFHDQAFFSSEASAREYMHAQIADQPTLVTQLHVIPQFETFSAS